VRRSAGILLFRWADGVPEVLLIHPGGPFWRKKDVGAWQIPKGEIEEGEDPLVAAVRETEEELGIDLSGRPVALLELRQRGGKIVQAFVLEQDVDTMAIVSNVFEMEWPPKRGETQSFPEVDRARWLQLPEARTLMLESQRPLLDAFAAQFQS
jgi:predicted NUDIX family NTP pyrophosphohydrolase